MFRNPETIEYEELVRGVLIHFCNFTKTLIDCRSLARLRRAADMVGVTVATYKYRGVPRPTASAKNDRAE